MSGCHACNMSCLYCSAETDNSKNFKADWAQVYRTIRDCPISKPYLKDGKKLEDVDIMFDIWGGNPLFHFEAFKETVENLKKLFPKAQFRSSDNGMSFKDDEKIQYCIDNGIHLQLSHDGIGQWIRSGDFDPLYDPSTADAIKECVLHGYIDSINCLLTQYNCSPMKNIEYYNKWRKEIGLINPKGFTIRLNHPWQTCEKVNKINVNGRWQDTIREDLIGKPIGSLNFSGEELNTFMHEYRMLGHIVRTPSLANSNEFKPYAYYTRIQTTMYTTVNSEFSSSQECRDFQRGIIDYTFSLDTMGRYCQCNLLDGDQEVPNPSCTADYCRGCKYENFKACMTCGASPKAETCEFQREFARMNEEFYLLDKKCMVFVDKAFK